MTTTSVAARPGPDPADQAAPDSYEYLNAALAHLARHPGDADDVRLQAAQAFLQLGLAAPAHELLETAGPAVQGHPEFSRMLTRIPASLGRRSWASRKTRLQRNLDVLARGGFAVEAIAQRWEEVSQQYELYVDNRGVEQVRFRPTGQAGVWLPLLGDHRRLAAAAPLPPDHEQLMPGPYVFEGLDLGWTFARIWEQTADTFLGYSSALYVVEPEAALIALVLHLHDWTKLLADPRVKLFVGPDCTGQFEQAMLDARDWPIPTQAYRLSTHRPGPQPDARTAVATVIDTRSRRVADSLAAVEARYRDRDAAYWARRYAAALDGSGPPLRVLAAVSTHTSFLQYSMRDARQAVEKLGHQFRILTEATAYEKPGAATYHREILRFDPDLFFILDHIRPSFAGLVPTNLPIMTWDQDALPGVFTEEKVRQMSPLDTLVGLPHYECLARFDCDPRQFLAVQMPTNPEQWDGSQLSEADLEPYRCDVSYVSHASQTPEAFHEAELAAYNDPNVRRLLNDMLPAALAIVDAGQPIKGHTLRRVLADSERRTGVRVTHDELRDRLIGWHLWRLCDRKFRHQALEWAAAWAAARGKSLRIYGNGWDKHPTLAPYAAGPAANGHELLCIYRASKINLQLMPAGFIHQRALDGLAAGAFFLTRVGDGDVRDPRHLPLEAKIRELGLQSGAEVLRSSDRELRQAYVDLSRYHGFGDDQHEDLYHFLRVDAGWQYAADAFGRMAELSFNDASSFARAADRFVDDADGRRAVADEMRPIVVDRYSYQATLRRFLRFAGDYFAALATDGPAKSGGRS
ncbi:MAG: hypothetical protein IID40_02380 [Planctomycetes bacterium]|nr:hypothetical protein [Planctomycetota bacterium]